MLQHGHEGFEILPERLDDFSRSRQLLHDMKRSDRRSEKNSSNDIIAGNGRILSVHEYCVVKFV